MKPLALLLISILFSGVTFVHQLLLPQQVSAQTAVKISAITGTPDGGGSSGNAGTVEIDLYQGAKDVGLPGADTADPDDAGVGFGLFVSQVLNIVLVIAALMVFLYLVWGGMEWISAGGDKSKIEKARNRIMQSIIGMIVLASMAALFMMLQSFLGIELFLLGH